ncbi:MAG: hypothetical protein U9Q92_06700 [archaeon]|nr:hypothetical protein [archaeon]
MPKLPRIIRHVGDYDDVDELEMVGSGYVSASRVFEKLLCIKTPQEKEWFRLGENVARSSEEEFFGHVNKILEEKGFYLTYLNYTPKGWGGLRPQKLEGTFYREKQLS